ncbi:MAG TPA: hypothetical protein VMU34_06800 [Mycobacterium sp.]|nr:hypothetical protein [Mycobacterium sp.]
MRNLLLRAAATVALLFAVGSIPAAALMSGSPGADRAANGCGRGWYFNTYTQSCQPWGQDAAGYGAPSGPPAPGYGYGYGPPYRGAISACVNAAGPLGFLSGSLCI